MESKNTESIIVEIFKSNQLNQVKDCFTLLNKLFNNIIANPNESKFRQFNKNNEHLKTKVLNLKGTIDLLLSVGYTESIETTDLYIYSSNSTDSLKKTCELLTQSLKLIENKLQEKEKLTSSSNNHKEEGDPVVLLVYDISNGLAANLSPMFLGKRIEGVWHTGLVVFGIEYYFGGGICTGLPKKTPYGYPVKEIKIGYTQIPKDLFEEYLKEIKFKYSAESYNLIENNCNHFTNAIAEFLTGKGIPTEILKQHEVLLESPMGKMIMPMLQQMGQGSVPNAFEKR